jgi:hypothetical protein
VLNLCLKRKFPRISDAKIKKGYFLVQDVKFEDQLSEVEKEAWKSLKNVTTIFFWEIIRQKSIVKWWLILCSPTTLKLKLNSVALVHERTIPTERPPPVGEVSANFCG